MVKENQWVGRNVDLKLLSQRLVKFFQDDGFREIRTEEDPNGSWYEIQAKKTGILRTLGSSRKAIHINIKGNPNNFEVEMGVGDWGKNIAAAALLTGGIGLIGLGLDAEFKNKLWNYIKESVDSLENSKNVNLDTNNSTPGPRTIGVDGTRQTIPNPGQVETKFCMSCGKKIPVDARFCSSCGSSQ
jgi:hypothetical protein